MLSQNSTQCENLYVATHLPPSYEEHCLLSRNFRHLTVFCYVICLYLVESVHYNSGLYLMWTAYFPRGLSKFFYCAIVWRHSWRLPPGWRSLTYDAFSSRECRAWPLGPNATCITYGFQRVHRLERSYHSLYDNALICLSHIIYILYLCKCINSAVVCWPAQYRQSLRKPYDFFMSWRNWFRHCLVDFESLWNINSTTI